jgi:hypothetical protein
MHTKPGTPFVMCVGNDRIYAGVIWSSLYSASFSGVVILKPMKADNRHIRIQLGYPSPQFYTGEDRRSDSRIFQILQQAGKLKD